MEGPLLSSDFAFGNTDRSQWLTSTADDMALAAPSADDFNTNNNWNDFMTWNPNAATSQAQDVKPQATAGFPTDPKAPLFNRRQNSQLREPLLGLQSTDIPTSAPQMNNTAFSFGGDIDTQTAFEFEGNALSSPSTGEAQQQNGFYSPPMWGQQQQQQAGANALFSPQGYDQSGLSSAVAPPLSTPSLHHSPSSQHDGRTSSSSAQSSPEPILENPKKRKSSSDDSDKPSLNKKDKQPPVKKTAHNMIEKRYRTNLNDKIAALRDSVPSLRVMSRPNGGNEEDDDPEDLEGLTPAHKLNKATVLSKATEYIRHLEKRNKRLQDDVTTLKGRLESYEKMAISGPMALHGHMGTPDANRYHEDPFSHASSMMAQSGPPQGMIPVPESIANLHRGLPPQAHYAPAYPQYTNGPGRAGLTGPPLINGRRSSAMAGKLMVGSLAGLMILEGFAERQPSKEGSMDRGLFALPFHMASILAPRVSLGMGAATTQLPLAKLLLVFGAVFYLIAPYLDFRAKPKKKTAPVILARAPSLASPVEVRRKAWLTAIQTVWVPQHNFLLEVAALSLKTLKLSIRKIIGWHGYAFLTGITKEQEAARVKAWLIALDAQLTGGDAEISKNRLVLSLMASGTLPDTPALLMLKALHIRVLLWELTNSRLGNWSVFEDISFKLARRYWNAARTEHRIAANMVAKPGVEAEPLPAHLAALVELECDQVLIPSIIQRAYSLAWNKPSAPNATMDRSMDSVIEDFAISSPLDALAAWWSSYASRKALVGYLASKSSTAKENIKNDLEIAAWTAPPNSQARLRALTAQAVILDENRASRIADACAALPNDPASSKNVTFKQPSQAIFMNLVGDSSVAADIRKALTWAKCLELVDSSNAEAHIKAIFVINNTFTQEANMTLLSFVAGYKVLRHFIQEPMLQTESSRGLERLASSLRMWVGHETGRRSGLSNKIRARVVGRCLDASKTLVGLAEPEDIDDGYCSSSVKGD